jgi:hypothetical protein
MDAGLPGQGAFSIWFLDGQRVRGVISIGPGR